MNMFLCDKSNNNKKKQEMLYPIYIIALYALSQEEIVEMS